MVLKVIKKHFNGTEIKPSMDAMTVNSQLNPSKDNLFNGIVILMALNSTAQSFNGF